MSTVVAAVTTSVDGYPAGPNDGPGCTVLTDAHAVSELAANVDISTDPLHRENRWDDPALAGARGDLTADLRHHEPRHQRPWRRVEARV